MADRSDTGIEIHEEHNGGGSGSFVFFVDYSLPQQLQAKLHLARSIGLRGDPAE